MDSETMDDLSVVSLLESIPRDSILCLFLRESSYLYDF